MPVMQQTPLPPNTGGPYIAGGSLYNAPSTGVPGPLAYGQNMPPNYNTPNVAVPPPYLTNELQQTPPPPPVVPYSPYPTYDPNAKPRSRKRLYIVIASVVIAALVLTGILYAVLNRGNGSGPALPGVASGPAASQTLNLSIVYSSDQLKITSVQQAAGYNDDKITYQTYTNLVRVNFNETELSKHPSFFSYMGSFRLLLPDKSVISPEKSASFSAPETGVVRDNWVDFGVNSKYDLTKLVLRLGTDEEAQMLVPLQPNADLSKYQPKTVSLNKTLTYSGVNWTIQSATQSLSADGSQAKTGQVYVTVSMIASNPGSDDFFSYDYLRLQSGATTVSQSTESSLNMPDSIKAGTTNVAATASFLVPASSNYTLIFIADNSSYHPVSQQTVPFTI